MKHFVSRVGDRPQWDSYSSSYLSMMTTRFVYLRKRISVWITSQNFKWTRSVGVNPRKSVSLFQNWA